MFKEQLFIFWVNVFVNVGFGRTVTGVVGGLNFGELSCIVGHYDGTVSPASIRRSFEIVF